MDLLQPDLITLDGACYRINDSQGFRKEEEYITYDDKPTQNNEQNEDENDIEDLIEDLEFVTESNGRVKVQLEVAFAYFGYIIGTKGSILRRIMNETRTDVKMPPRGKKGPIVVSGPEKKNVTAAVRRIIMIVWAARKKQKPTHFLSISVASDDVVSNFNTFKENILNNPPSGVNDTIFTKPAKLHLTLLVMCLMDVNERNHVMKLMEEACDKMIKPVLNSRPFDVKVSGISYMNDDPKVTKVLYADVKEESEEYAGALQKIMDDLTKFFSNKGYESNGPTGKLHVTLMNSSNRISKDNIPFDASDILKIYSDFNFGRVRVDKIHLSQMHTTAEDGYYQSSHAVCL